MPKSKIALFFLIGLVLLTAAAIGALWLVEPAIFRNQIETRASKAFGRTFRIQGDIALERSLRPRVILQGITIANPDWAAAKDFARAKEVAVQVALIPLLLGEMQVLDVRFAGVELFTEIRPDGANNFTFGKGDDRQATQRLPSIERLLIRNAVIHHRLARGKIDRYEVTRAQLWNIPGEPERIEAEGSAKGMWFRIQFAADAAAEVSGPQNPWSVHLDMHGPDMHLAFDGQMAQANTWDQLEGRLVARGQQVEGLETLFEAQIPLAGPFEIAADLRSREGVYRLTDLVARGQGPSGRPRIAITGGTVSGGPDAPLAIDLQGQLDETPLTLRLASERLPLQKASPSPWPLTAALTLADTALDIEGAVTTAPTGAKHFRFDGRLEGDTLDTLARLVGRDFPRTGAYQLKFKAAFGENGGEITGLEGFIGDTERWRTIQIDDGHASADLQGRLTAGAAAAIADVPLTLNLQAGPQTDAGVPVRIEAALPGCALKADGTVTTSGDHPAWQLAATMSGDRLDGLGNLMAVSLPDVGNYDVRARIHGDGRVHELRNLQAQVGANRFSGTVRWEDKGPRPLLTAQLSSGRLALGALKNFTAGPAPTSGPPGWLSRPLPLDWLDALDARLEIDVAHIAGGAIDAEAVRASIELSEGRLSAPFQARIFDAPAEGRLRLARRRGLADVALQGTIGRVDAAKTFRALDLPAIVDGRVDAIEFEGRSSGATPQTLLDQAEATLRFDPARLRYEGLMVAQEVAVTVARAEIVARPDRPLTAKVSGVFQTIPFEATLQAGRPADWRSDAKPLPVKMALQTTDLNFKAEGTITRPFEAMAFDLTHELSGRQIEALSPLIDIALPLRGQFRSRGSLAARGDRLRYNEDLKVGKSDLQAALTVWQGPGRPRISARLTSQAIHLDDIKLYETQAPGSAATQKRYLIPDYALPLDTLRSLDLELDLKAERIVTQKGDLSDLTSRARLQDGHLTSTLTMKGFTGASLRKVLEVNAAVDPPQNRLQFDAQDVDYGFLQQQVLDQDLAEGLVDVQIDLAGSGTTRRRFLANADGYVTIIGGPGRITGRRLDLWAADLIPTLLSPRWQRQSSTELNCMVAHVGVEKGQATIEDLLFDTQRITIAGSGRIEMETEAIDILIAPRPKRASLISLANPVEITGTLAEPDVSVAQLPSRRRLGRTGLLAGLINPAFLLTVFSDIGTNVSNPCEAAIDRAQEAADLEPD